MMNTFLEEQLSSFISIPTIANDEKANLAGIEFLQNLLNPLGFETSIEGDSPYFQPVLVAKHINANTDKSVVLYGHYDVEKIKDWEHWETPPFEMTKKDSIYFCRGIADNKGVLLIRIFAIKELLDEGEEIPNILWIIQGEEEVGGKTPFQVIPNQFSNFKSKLFVEETGIYKDEQPVIFHLPKADQPQQFLEDLNQAIYSGAAQFANRSLNKFSDCPFLHHIPNDGYYIGFGANDATCRIHKDNESINIQKLYNHKDIFKKFIKWVYLSQIN
jgi:acetylornithine deacetylase/succinyl-diaminopimelate desuccinylase-like protein